MNAMAEGPTANLRQFADQLGELLDRAPDAVREQVEASGPLVVGLREFSPDDLEISTQLLGKGSFGKVVKATLRSSSTDVAVKYLDPLAGAHASLAAKDFITAVRAEAHILGGLRHPNVVDLLGYSLNSDAPFLVMPLMEGGDLATYAIGRPSEHLRLLLDTARGMAHLHSMNIAHGDLRGVNVLVHRSGIAVVADFGLARTIGANGTGRLETFEEGKVGNTRWLAPERTIPGSTWHLTPDVFAYAMVCYEVVAGKIPFDGEKVEALIIMGWIREGRRPAAPVDAPSFSGELWALDLAALWDVEGDRRVWDARLELANGSMQSLDLTGLTVTKAGLAVLGRAFSHPLQFVTELKIANCGLGQDGAMVLSRLLPDTLQILDASKNAIGDAGALAFAARFPPQLCELRLRANELGDGGAEAIAAKLPPLLTILDLSYNQITGNGIRVSATKLGECLQELYLSNNKLGPHGMHAIAAKLPPTLLVLDLSYNEGGPEGAIALSAALPDSLHRLSLGRNALGDNGAVALAQGLPRSLRSLDLFTNGIGFAGMQALAKALPASLLELDLGQNRIGNNGARALADNMPPNLQLLGLTTNQIGTGGMVKLAPALPRSLLKLYLSYNEIGPAGAAALAAGMTPALISLDLSCNALSDAGAEKIADMLPNSLTSLGLFANSISDVGVQAVAAHLPRALVKLHLANNNVSDGGALALMDAVPGTLVELSLKRNRISADGIARVQSQKPASLRTLTVEPQQKVAKLKKSTSSSFLSFIRGE
ncbi:hypothetical protein H9P43_003917 [Blastocladiella emersonii ATCC 22665]|nr:hypothetical protein H9P43_003917 [Blastocladiella emersonii ATCC 22665]